MKRVTACVAVVLASCLFPDLGGLAGTDASIDAGDAAAGDPAVMIVHTGAVMSPSGNAQQAHLVWARVTKTWWLFYIDDDTTKIKTRWSTDFKSWTDGAPVTLPYTNASDGRSFSVGYADLGNTDVVHVTMSHPVSPSNRIRTHVRATITSGGVITFGSVQDASSVTENQPALDPDSPSVAINAGGRVFDATGWTFYYTDAGVGNANVYVAQNVDNGASWTFGFTKDNVEQVDNFVNARQIFAAGAACSPILFWEKADFESDPTNVRASCKSTVWSSPTDAFGTSAPQDANDWCAAFLAAEGKSHVVRATLAGNYEHASFDVGMAQVATAPPSLVRRGRTGLVLLSNSVALTLVDLGADDRIHAVKFSSGTWDASWTTIDSFAHVRSALSSASVDVADQTQSGGAAIIWTQPSSSGGSDILGMLVQ